jgi:hypothetical protein
VGMRPHHACPACGGGDDGVTFRCQRRA